MRFFAGKLKLKAVGPRILKILSSTEVPVHYTEHEHVTSSLGKNGSGEIEFAAANDVERAAWVGWHAYGVFQLRKDL